MSKNSEPPAALGRGGVSEAVCGLEAGQLETTANSQKYQQCAGNCRTEAGSPAGAVDRAEDSISADVARKITPKPPRLWEQILRSLVNGPATPEQISKAIGRHFTTVRPRISELARRGKVIATGQRGDGALGGKSMIWRLATPSEIEAFEAVRMAGQ